MLLGGVLWHEAEHLPGVLQVAVAPPVVRKHVEDIEPEAVGRVDAPLDHLDDVSLAAPDGVVAGLTRPVFLVDRADAQAEDRKIGRVRKMPRQRLAPDLAAAVEPA